MPPSRTLPHHDPDALATWAQQLIARRVAYFLATHPHPPDLFDDLLQDCLEHFWRQRGKYRPDRGASLATWLRHLTDNKLRDVARGWQASKRGWDVETLGLEEPLGADADLTPLDLAPDTVDVAGQAIGRLTGSALLARFSERQQQLVRELGAGYSMAQVSRRLGIARSTLRDELARLQAIVRRDQG